MTYARIAGTPESVLTKALQDLVKVMPMPEIEKAVEKSLSALYKAANPMTSARLHFVDAAALDRLCAQHGLGRPFGVLFRALTEIEDEKLPAPRDALLDVARHLGAIATAQAEGDQDGAARAWEALLIAARQGHAAAARQHEGVSHLRAVAP